MRTFLFALLLLCAVTAGFGKVLLYFDGMFCNFAAEAFLLAKLL